VFRVRKIYSVQAGAVVCFGSFSDLPLCFHAERAKAPQFLALVQSRTTQTAEKRARDCTWHLTSHFTSLHFTFAAVPAYHLNFLRHSTVMDRCDLRLNACPFTSEQAFIRMARSHQPMDARS